MKHIGYTTGEAAKYTGRHPKTLQALDRRGILPASRTSTGRRYWHKADLDGYLGKARVPVRRRLAYCRVSSQSQRSDLSNQREVVEQFCMAKGLDGVEYLLEIAGGLNFKRSVFLKLVDAIVAGEVEVLVIAHQDRLLRFGFDLIKHLCSSHDCQLLVINTEKMSPEQEIVQDLMTIIHCFSSRLYGLRSYKKSLKEALK